MCPIKIPIKFYIYRYGLQGTRDHHSFSPYSPAFSPAQNPEWASGCSLSR